MDTAEVGIGDTPGTPSDVDHGSAGKLVYDGNVDVSTALRLEGWARRSGGNATQCYVSIVSQGRLLARVKADLYRPDLAEHGLGHGCWGFSVDLTGKALFAGDVVECLLDDGVATLYVPARANKPMPPATIEHAHDGRRANVVEAAYVYVDQYLSVITCLYSREFDGSSVELISDGLVLQAKNASSLPADGGVCEVEFGVPCSLRTAQGRLEIRVNGATFPVHPKLEDATAPVSGNTQPLPYAGTVVGNLDGFVSASNGTLLVKGWARDIALSDRPVFVDVSVNGAPVGHALADEPRPDVAAALGGTSFCGFAVEVPDNLRLGGTVCVEVRARAENSKISGSGMSLPLGAQGKLIGALPRLAPPRLSEPDDTSQTFSDNCTIAAIVLNQDGGHLLDQLFSSIIRHERNTFSRILLIDHASADDSISIADAYKDRLPIEVIEGDRTASFSESNNRGVALCNDHIVAFINNDITFTRPIVRQMAKAASSAETGAVGVKLFDYPGERSSIYTTQHLGIHFSPRTANGISAIETRAFDGELEYATSTIEVPAVTAALMVMERSKFTSVGGFDERYFYGQEDVDLCLKIVERGFRNICMNGISAVHMRGYSRRRMPSSLVHRRAANKSQITASWGYALRRAFASIDQRPYLTGRPLTVGVVVSEIGDTATAGDYMTGLELGLAISEQQNAQVRLMTPADADARGFDIIISMLDGFDVREIRNLNSSTILVAWARNWFNRWASRPWRERFSFWFASSGLAVDYLTAELGKTVWLMPIATNPDRFASNALQSPRDVDLVFSGSYWGSPREIVDIISEAQLSPAVYGANWEGVPEMAALTKGEVPYDRLPSIYSSAKIVIDDANSATKSWGSINSRVFDALSSGALPITNNSIGSKELFDDRLPVYRDANSFTQIVRKYATDEAGRMDLVESLKEIVDKHHTYDCRAREMFERLRGRSASGIRVSIKIGAPKISKAEPWGDYHFALALRRELEQLGNSVRIDCHEDWYGAHADADDAVIALSGLGSYKPSPTQINIIWLISHPHDVAIGELKRYDRVFVASSYYTDVLAQQGVDATYLPQATDTTRFFAVAPIKPTADYIFLGNSRGIRRPVVRYAEELQGRFELYGGGWSGLTSHPVKSTLVENSKVPELYRSAGAVLNDHWDDMRSCGFISNRIFDAIACGIPVISDDVPGMSQIFGDSVLTYSDGLSFAEAVQWLDANRDEALAKARAAASRVAAHHGFDKRAEVFDAVFRDEDAKRARLKRIPSPSV